MAEEKKGLVQEFMDFLMKYQVIGLAVAFIIGAAATKMVTACVSDIIMPIIAVLIPGGDWRNSVLQLGPVKLLVGDFVGAIIDFVIIALVVFLVVRYMMKGDTSKKI
jgi:large conductance mechanosensitive channel